MFEVTHMMNSRIKLKIFFFKTINGINRPAIATMFPTKKSETVMLDLGANVYVNANNLMQFALMGYAYFSIIDPKRNPKIGLINIGTENNKGLEGLIKQGIAGETGIETSQEMDDFVSKTKENLLKRYKANFDPSMANGSLFGWLVVCLLVLDHTDSF